VLSLRHRRSVRAGVTGEVSKRRSCVFRHVWLFAAQIPADELSRLNRRIVELQRDNETLESQLVALKVGVDVHP
jgi:hypothetical protein